MKMRLLLALVGLATGFVVPTFAQDTVDPKTAQQIHALAAKSNEQFKKQDPAALAALYTEDAVWDTYHGKFRGRQQIEKNFADWDFKRWKMHNWVTTISRVTRVGNEVRATGNWYTDLDGGYDKGHCTWILVREGDTWRIRRETMSAERWPTGINI